MYNHTCLELLQRAEGGEKLETGDRRRTVAWLITTHPEYNNNEIAAKFSVSEGSIRQDRKAIREAMAKEIKEDDVSLVIADILYDFRRQINDIERSKAKCVLGTTVYLQHCKEAMGLRLRTVESLQTLGYLPKNLGSQTTTEFKYLALVQPDGSVESRPLTMFDKETQGVVAQRSVAHREIIDIKAEVVEDDRSVKYDAGEPDTQVIKRVESQE